MTIRQLEATPQYSEDVGGRQAGIWSLATVWTAVAIAALAIGGTIVWLASSPSNRRWAGTDEREEQQKQQLAERERADAIEAARRQEQRELELQKIAAMQNVEKEKLAVRERELAERQAVNQADVRKKENGSLGVNSRAGGLPQSHVIPMETTDTGKKQTKWGPVGALGEFHGHSSAVRAVAFSPDGILVASGGHEREIIVWDVATRTVRQRLGGHRMMVGRLRFSPDGKRLVSSSILDYERVDMALAGAAVKLFTGARQSAQAKLLQPRDDYTLRLWDVVTGKQLHDFDGHQTAVGGLQFSADGTLLYASTEGKIIVFDVETGKRVDAFAVWTERELCNGDLALSLDGKLALINSRTRMHLIDLETRRTRKKLTAPGDGIASLMCWQRSISKVAFFPDATKCAFGTALDTSDSVVLICDVKRGTEERNVGGNLMFWVSGLEVLPDGLQVAVTSYFDKVGFEEAWNIFTGKSAPRPIESSLRICNTETGAQTHSFTTEHGWCFDLDVSADGRLAVTGHGDGAVCIWGMPQPPSPQSPPPKNPAEMMRLVGHLDPITCVAISEDGSRVLSGGGKTGLKGPRDNVTRLWNAKTGEMIATFDADSQKQEAPIMVGFSRDAKRLFIVRTGAYVGSGSLRVWNITSGKLDFESIRDFRAAQLSSKGTAVLSTAYTGKSPIVSIGGRTLNSSFEVFLTELNHPKHWLQFGRGLHAGEIQVLAVSSDDSLLASGSEGGVIKVWDINSAKSGRPLHSFNSEGSILQLDFSADRSMLLSAGDKSPVIWMIGGTRHRRLIGHDGFVTAATFVCGDRFVLTAGHARKNSSDGYQYDLRLWDPKNGHESDRHDLSEKAVTGIAFSRDGQLAVFGAKDRTVRILNMTEIFPQLSDKTTSVYEK